MGHVRRMLFLVGLSLTLPVWAESGGRYEPWTPARGGGDMSRLIHELDGAIDDATRDQAASPNFLRDLRVIVDRYRHSASSPPSSGYRPGRTGIADDFSDGDYTRNPAWMVQSGSFRVDRSGALFSEVMSGNSRTTSSNSSTSKRDANLELVLGVMEILGASKGGSSPSSDSSATGLEETARISLSSPIANAFDLSLTVRSDTSEGAMAVGVFQDPASDAYQVLFHADRNRRTLQLVKFTRGAAKLVDSEELTRISLDDGRDHSMNWSRTSQGEMRVALDGMEILRATDATFRDAFEGVAITNHSGAFAVDNVEIRGN